MAMSDREFFNPKSVYKGTNADGTKFTVAEWSFGSMGDGNGEGWELTFNFVGILALMFIATPLIFLFSVYTYSGKVAIKHLVGLFTGISVLIDSSNDWIASQFTAIVIDIFFGVGSGNATIHWLVIVTSASLICLIAMILISIVTRGSLFENEDKEKNRTNGIIVIAILIGLFFFTYVATKSITKDHKQYYERTL